MGLEVADGFQRVGGPNNFNWQPPGAAAERKGRPIADNSVAAWRAWTTSQGFQLTLYTILPKI